VYPLTYCIGTENCKDRDEDSSCLKYIAVNIVSPICFDNCVKSIPEYILHNVRSSSDCTVVSRYGAIRPRGLLSLVDDIPLTAGYLSRVDMLVPSLIASKSLLATERYC